MPLSLCSLRALEVFRLKALKEAKVHKDALNDAKNLIAQLQQNSESWKSVKNTALLGGTAAIAAKMTLGDLSTSGAYPSPGTPGSQHRGKMDKAIAMSSLAPKVGETGANKGNSGLSFSDLLSPSSAAPPVVESHGVPLPSPAPSPDKWTALAESAAKKPTEVEPVKTSSRKVPHTGTDLADVSEEEEEDDDDDELEENWKQGADSVVLVLNAEGNLGPGLKSEVAAAAKKAKELAEQEQKIKNEEAKKAGPHKSTGSMVLKQQHDKNQAQSANAIPMSNYAKKALSSTAIVSYLTRASRLHLSADKIVIKVLQG